MYMFFLSVHCYITAINLNLKFEFPDSIDGRYNPGPRNDFPYVGGGFRRSFQHWQLRVFQVQHCSSHHLHGRLLRGKYFKPSKCTVMVVCFVANTSNQVGVP